MKTYTTIEFLNNRYKNQYEISTIQQQHAFCKIDKIAKITTRITMQIAYTNRHLRKPTCNICICANESTVSPKNERHHHNDHKHHDNQNEHNEHHDKSSIIHRKYIDKPSINHRQAIDNVSIIHG